MQCPECRLLSPDGAVRCDCGYEFATGTVKPPAPSAKSFRAGWPLARVAIVLFAAGILVAPIAIYSGALEIRLLNRIAIGEEAPTEVSESDTRRALIAFAKLAVYITAGLFFLAWVHRAYKNLSRWASARSIRLGGPSGISLFHL